MSRLTKVVLLVFVCLLYGCRNDYDDFQWIQVTPDEGLAQEYREFILDIRSDSRNFEAIYGSGDRLVAVGDDGIIVRSEDGGETWSQTSVGYGTLHAIYGAGDRLVAVGDDGIIVRSEDGGETWSQTSVGYGTLHAIYGAGDRLVAVGGSGIILRSEDGGKTWSKTGSGVTNQYLTAIYGAGDRLVAVGGSGIILRSEDGGKTWSKTGSGVTNQYLTAIYGAGDRLVAVGWRGTIVRSKDGGKTWSETRNSATNQTLQAIYGSGDRLVAVGDHGAFVRSEDGGKTWTKEGNHIINDTNHFKAIYGAGDRLEAVGGSGIILRSEDGGKTWSKTGSGVTDEYLTAIYGVGDRLVAVGWRGTIVRSKDGGKTWSETRNSATHQTLQAIYGSDDRLVAVGDDGAFVRSEDGGKTWSETRSSVTNKYLNAIYGSGARLVALGRNGTIVRSEDGGKTWSETLSSVTNQNFYAIDGAGDLLVAVGSGGTIVRSVDGGKTWSKTGSGVTDTHLNGIYCAGDRLVAVGNNGTMMRSEDGGKTWTKADSYIINDIHFNAIYGSGDRLVAVGSRGIIVRSEDGGKTWSEPQNRFNTNETLRAIHGSGDRLIVVGDGGIIERSEDGGKTWTKAGSGITNQNLHAIYVSGDRLVAVGENGTIILLNSAGLHWPALKQVGYRSDPGIGGKLSLKIELSDPDNLCKDNDCTVQAQGRNEVDLENQRNLNQVQLTHTPGSTLWEAKVTPRDFSVQSGEYFNLEISLIGRDFALGYPAGNTAYKIPYQVDLRPYHVAATASGVLALLLMLYWLRPLWLLAIYRRLAIFEFVGKLNIPVLKEVFQMVMSLLAVPWLIARPRVLDAWIEQNLDAWKAVFKQVESAANVHYVPLPLYRFDTNETIRTPSSEMIAKDYAEKHMLLQVVGVGGSGKTSLAAQIGRWALQKQLARHRIVPVWLDAEVVDVRKWLVQRVREVSRDDELPEVFIHALFKKKRLLLIVDRLSERQASSQEAMKHLPDWLAAMVVTTRYMIDFNLPGVKRIETLGLDSETVMGFIEELLKNADGGDTVINLQTKAKLVGSFARMITVDGKEEKITPLLVTLFVKKVLTQMSATANDLPSALPTSIPEVYFEYLCGVNPEDQSAMNYLPREEMLQAAVVLACAELGDDFRPKRIDLQEASKTLANVNLTMKALRRLVDNYVLEQRQEGGGYLVAFALDPVAEYLAAFGHAKRCGNNDDAWRELVGKVRELGEQTNGFMVALKITHQTYSEKYGWAKNVIWDDTSATP